jgi:aryl-alcohol dehydrogenase-like predicted oxidoreductase
MSFSIPTPTGLPNEDESLAVLTTAADMGITTFVTSDYYGPFHNETLLGRWFRETSRRDEIFLVTKFGPRIEDGKMSVDGHPEYVKEAFEKSLKRLGTRVDLYMSHRIDPKTPIELTVQAMKELVQQGKVKYIGLSECSASTLRRAHAVHPIAAVEMEFSPFALDIEDPKTNFLATARELGVKIICYSPLGRGFLTGAIKTRDDVDPMRKIMPRFSEENFPDNMKIVDGFREMSRDKGCTPGQIALAWVLAQGEGEPWLGSIMGRIANR